MTDAAWWRIQHPAAAKCAFRDVLGCASGAMRLSIFLLSALIVPQLYAATVVTKNERIAGTITEQSKTSVSIKM